MEQQQPQPQQIQINIAQIVEERDKFLKEYQIRQALLECIQRVQELEAEKKKHAEPVEAKKQ